MNFINPTDPADIKLIKQLNRQNYSVYKNKSRPDQTNFRNEVIKYFNVCPITGLGPDECEAAHIIPVSSNGEYILSNGLLLGAQIHKTFDKYLWSINPLTYQIVCKPNAGSIGLYNPNSLIGIIGPKWNIYLQAHWDIFIS